MYSNHTNLVIHLLQTVTHLFHTQKCKISFKSQNQPKRGFGEERGGSGIFGEIPKENIGCITHKLIHMSIKRNMKEKKKFLQILLEDVVYILFVRSLNFNIQM